MTHTANRTAQAIVDTNDESLRVLVISLTLAMTLMAVPLFLG